MFVDISFATQANWISNLAITDTLVSLAWNENRARPCSFRCSGVIYLKQKGSKCCKMDALVSPKRKDILGYLAATRALFQYQIRRLILRSRNISKPWDLYSELSDHSEIIQAPQQHCCRRACQISKRYEHFNTRSRAFETLRDLTIRHLMGYWKGVQCSGAKASVAVELTWYQWLSARLQYLQCISNEDTTFLN